VRVREIDGDEGHRLVRIVRRDSGSVVTWRRAQIVLLSAQGMDVAGIAKVAFTSENRVREVICNFNADGFDSFYPRYGGRPPAEAHPRQLLYVPLVAPGMAARWPIDRTFVPRTVPRLRTRTFD